MTGSLVVLDKVRTAGVGCEVCGRAPATLRVVLRHPVERNVRYFCEEHWAASERIRNQMEERYRERLSEFDERAPWNIIRS